MYTSMDQSVYPHIYIFDVQYMNIESSNQNNQKCSRQEIAEWVSIPSEMKTTVLHSIAYS